MLTDNNNNQVEEGQVLVNEETGELYYQGERVLSAFEKRYQSKLGDIMDIRKIEDYNTLEWEHYDFDRCGDTNSIIYDGVRPIVEAAVRRGRMDRVHPFIRAWCFPCDDVPLKYAGDLALALSLFKDDTAEFGRWQATVRFIAKLVRAHARSVKNGVNFNDNTAEDWVHQGMLGLFGWDGETDYHTESLPHDASGETESDKQLIVEALSRKFKGPLRTQVLAGLRRFRMEYEALLRELERSAARA